MSQKSWVMIGMAVGGYVGDFVASWMSLSSLSLSGALIVAAGGLGGIWAGYRFSQWLG